MSDAVANGLEGVVVAETQMASVDGEGGRLWIRGHDVERLAGSASFEGVCALLWNGEDPHARAPAERLRPALGRARVEAFERLPRLGGALDTPNGMDALRGALSQLHSPDAGGSRTGEEGERVRITAGLAVFAAAWTRRALQGGADPIAPDPALGHAEDYLRMLGLARDPARSAGLDAYLATVAEHGMCASTFTARVVASTDSDDVSAIVAAIGALKGPLHGGAPGPVLDMLEAVAAPEHARAWLEGELEAGRRIMGMGHRVYRVRDPRAAVLERTTLALERAGISTQRLALARAVETAAATLLRERYPDRPLEANVEFYTAVLLDTLGLPRELFTPTFAVARVAGWLGHVAEQHSGGRIIRPRCRYVGPVPAAA